MTATNGTGHSRHVNSHPPDTETAAHLGHLSVVGRSNPLTILDVPITKDDETDELTVTLDPEVYTTFRRDSSLGRQLPNMPIWTTIIFREVSGKLTGRWFVRRLTPDGWETAAEATVPERAAL